MRQSLKCQSQRISNACRDFWAWSFTLRITSEVTAPLRELLKKDVAWHWTECHEQSLVAIKKVLTETSPAVLRYYDPKKPVGLQVDACKSGLGAVLVQDGSPIVYASRSLKETECRYAQIEKELLAVVFGVERFHQHIYAKEVTVETDHRPLLSIISKPLDKTLPRLQRMLLKLQRYHINLQYTNLVRNCSPLIPSQGHTYLTKATKTRILYSVYTRR